MVTKTHRQTQTEQTEPETNEIAILARILRNGKAFSPTLARQLLKLGFSDEEKARMHELAVKNQESRISPRELRELDSYVKAGDLLAILQSKARKALRSKSK